MSAASLAKGIALVYFSKADWATVNERTSATALGTNL